MVALLSNNHLINNIFYQRGHNIQCPASFHYDYGFFSSIEFQQSDMARRSEISRPGGSPAILCRVIRSYIILVELVIRVLDFSVFLIRQKLL